MNVTMLCQAQQYGIQGEVEKLEGDIFYIIPISL